MFCFSCATATATLFDSLVGNRKPVYHKQHTEDANVKKMLKISTFNLDMRTTIFKVYQAEISLQRI